jgi:hypothetical protein
VSPPRKDAVTQPLVMTVEDRDAAANRAIAIAKLVRDFRDVIRSLRPRMSDEDAKRLVLAILDESAAPSEKRSRGRPLGEGAAMDELILREYKHAWKPRGISHNEVGEIIHSLGIANSPDAGRRRLDRILKKADK